MHLAVAVHLDSEGLGEVALVVVEGGDGGGIGAADRDEDLELERLLALACRHHPAAATEERVARDVEVRVEAESSQKLDRPVAPAVPPAGDGVGLSDPHHLALMKHLQAGGVAGRLVAEHVGAAGVNRDAARRQHSAPGDGGVDRVARGGHENEVAHRLMVAPVLVAARPLLLLGRVRLRALEAEDRAGEVRKRLQIAGGLELAARHERRKAEQLGCVWRRGAVDRGIDGEPDLLERAGASVHPGDPARNQVPGDDELGEEGFLLRGSGPEVGHRLKPPWRSAAVRRWSGECARWRP